MAFALYLHIPFCAQKCAYCDFASFPNRAAQWDQYFTALQGEIFCSREIAAGRKVTSIFFGGGTPTLVPAHYIADTMAAIKDVFDIEPMAEISLEANPGTVDAEKLAALKNAGFNRISFGAQSFDNGLLQAIGRIHTARDIEAAVVLARNAGFENLNLDLMYGLPGQSTNQWEATLTRAIALSPQHISAYSLIVEPGTPIAAKAESGSITLPDEECVVNMQRTATRLLGQAGLRRYEISNFALPGRECRHNLLYWQRGEYLGLGCAAHSFINGERFFNPSQLDQYLTGKRKTETERPEGDERILEMIMLATRTVQGLSLNAFYEETGLNFTDYAPAAQMLVQHGLATLQNGYFALTEKGMEVQNAVVLQLVS